MNVFEKVLIFIKSIEIEKPLPYGWFHLMWLGLMVLAILLLCTAKNSGTKRFTRNTLLVYTIVSWVLEITKQLINSVSLTEAGTVVWSYQWYTAPFQFCTTPFIASLAILLMKDGKAKDATFAYLAFYTILGGCVSMFYPNTLFLRTLEIDIHTMFIHAGSVVLSMYLLISGVVKPDWKRYLSAIPVFVVFVAVAEALNVIVYYDKVLNPSTEAFNMFFISPFFDSELPVFSTLKPILPYALFVFLYLVAVSLGALVVFLIARAVRAIFARKRRPVSATKHPRRPPPRLNPPNNRF